MAQTRIALAGCGSWGKNLARNLSELGALAVIVDPSPAARAVAESLGAVWTADLTGVLEDPSVAALVVATPAATHADVAQRAMLAGKDVFVEKPIALTAEDARRMTALARDLGRILMVGHLLQYHPVFNALADLVKAGNLGHIRQISSSRLNLGVIRTEENVLWSFAPHDISMVQRLAGQVPLRVAAVGTTVLQEGIEDITTLHLQFPGGLKADITSSWLHPQKEQKLIVVGDEGMAIFSDTRVWAEKLQVFRNKVTWVDQRPKAIAGAAEYIVVPEGEPLRLELQHFIHCVETRTQPKTDGEEALGVLRTLVAAQRSLDQKGEWVTPEKQSERQPASFFVHPTAIVDEGASIGAGSKIWHFSHVLARTKIGDRCVIGQNAMIGPDVTIGNGCKIQNNVSIYKGVTLEDDVFCGPSMVFTNVLTPRAHLERKDEFAPTRIGRGATLGANCTIVCGNNIGAYSMVGAGAVVTKNVPDHALVVGNPARQIGWVSKAGERLGSDMICPRTNEDYRFLLRGKA